MPSFWAKVLHSVLSLAVLAVSVYVFIEKKMIIGGRLTPSSVYEFPFPANLIMATSLFFLSLFIILTLIDSKIMKKVCEWLLITALILFFTAAFI